MCHVLINREMIVLTFLSSSLIYYTGHVTTRKTIHKHLRNSFLLSYVVIYISCIFYPVVTWPVCDLGSNFLIFACLRLFARNTWDHVVNPAVSPVFVHKPWSGSKFALWTLDKMDLLCLCRPETILIKNEIAQQES